MKIKKNPLLVGALVAVSPVFADEEVPATCLSAANYAAQVLDLGLSEGGPADNYDPDRITIKKDFAQYPIRSTSYLGDCNSGGLKKEWCEIAGGSAEVYQVEVDHIASPDTTPRPHASVIITYNRGGCKVREVVKKSAWSR